tara:strand:+ start:2308 stop:2487 length:180 start_codon:yes stop_codon:yes gene_type:complete
MKSGVKILDTENIYPLYVTSNEYEKLLVIQSKPEYKIWFKDKEIDSDKLVEILLNANCI